MIQLSCDRLVFCVVFCRSLFVFFCFCLLAIAMFALLLFTASDSTLNNRSFNKLFMLCSDFNCIVISLTVPLFLVTGDSLREKDCFSPDCPFLIAPSVFPNVYLLFTSPLKLSNILLHLSLPINETTINNVKPDSVL